MATNLECFLASRIFPTRTPFVTFKDASAESTLSESTLRRLAKAGRLQTKAIGGRVLILRESFDSLLTDLS